MIARKVALRFAALKMQLGIIEYAFLIIKFFFCLYLLHDSSSFILIHLNEHQHGVLDTLVDTFVQRVDGG